jgi:hypothetical protein
MMMLKTNSFYFILFTSLILSQTDGSANIEDKRQNSSSIDQLNVALKQAIEDRDWSEAVSVIKKNPNASDIKSEYLEQVVGVWADQNLNEAADWVLHLPEGKSRLSAYVTLAYQLYQRSPKDSFMWMQKLEKEDERAKCMASILNAWRDGVESPMLNYVKGLRFSNDFELSIFKASRVILLGGKNDKEEFERFFELELNGIIGGIQELKSDRTFKKEELNVIFKKILRNIQFIHQRVTHYVESSKMPPGDLDKLIPKLESVTEAVHSLERVKITLSRL